MTRAAVGTLCTVLLLACALRVAQRGHPPAHNPLELWNTAMVQISAENSGASIRCNVTVLEGAHTWVEVSWSGLRAGADCSQPTQMLPRSAASISPWTNYSLSVIFRPQAHMTIT